MCANSGGFTRSDMRHQWLHLSFRVQCFACRRGTVRAGGIILRRRCRERHAVSLELMPPARWILRLSTASHFRCCAITARRHLKRLACSAIRTGRSLCHALGHHRPNATRIVEGYPKIAGGPGAERGDGRPFVHERWSNERAQGPHPLRRACAWRLSGRRVRGAEGRRLHAGLDPRNLYRRRERRHHLRQRARDPPGAAQAISDRGQRSGLDGQHADSADAARDGAGAPHLFTAMQCRLCWSA
jgi:hypothetical protein